MQEFQHPGLKKLESITPEPKEEDFIPLEAKAAKVPCSRYPSTVNVDEGVTVFFASPRFPRKYPRNQLCGWRFKGAHENIRFTVSCHRSFHLEKKRRGRCVDFLRLGTDVICDKSRPVGWRSSSEDLYAWFRSNKKHHYRGFYCWATAYSVGPPPETTTGSSSNSDCSCGIPNRATRIVGGIETEVNEYPWQVAIAFAGNDDFQNFYCGGSIINKRWVLSAAHCEVSTSDQVIVGAHSWFTPTSSHRRVNIESVINHPNYYVGANYNNDVALVKLSEDLDFNDVGLTPVCLPNSGSTNTYADYKAIVMGWGKLDYGTNNFPSELREVEVDVVTNARCELDYSPSQITDNMLCAGIDEGGKDSCQGDSGGPLVAEESSKYVQIGVISWGYGCAHEDYFGVYARVTSFVDWITNNIDNNEICHA